MLHFCIELNIIGPVDKNARFDERPIARIFIVNNDWVLLYIQRVGIHWVYFGGVWFTLVLLRSDHWDLAEVKTVWVDKMLGGHQVGSIAFKRTTSSEVECFGWVSVKIKSEVIWYGKPNLYRTHRYLYRVVLLEYRWNVVHECCDWWMIIWTKLGTSSQGKASLQTRLPGTCNLEPAIK